MKQTRRLKSRGKIKIFCRYCKRPCYLRYKWCTFKVNEWKLRDKALEVIYCRRRFRHYALINRQYRCRPTSLDFLFKLIVPHVSQRELFSSYTPINCGKTLMRNNAVCKPIGIGTVQIKTEDERLRTLTEVHHMLELKNFISLGQLDSMDYKIVIESRWWRSSRGRCYWWRVRRLEPSANCWGQQLLEAPLFQQNLSAEFRFWNPLITFQNLF